LISLILLRKIDLAGRVAAPPWRRRNRIVLAQWQAVCSDDWRFRKRCRIGVRMPPRQIDYYFSLTSPWAYIGHSLFREVVSTYNCVVNYKPVVLLDLFSETGGLPLVKRHPVRQRYRMLELQRWRDKRGLNFHLRPAHSPFNGRLADGVVIAAIEAGNDPDTFLRRAFSGVFEQQLDLADPATLVKLANDSGLPGEQLIARAYSDEISAAYEQNRLDGLAADVFGSPAYVLDGEVFWGQDRIELLADALESGRPPYRSQG
jgi:2-hydroxychromene-2-carboxylate isomerase